MKAIFFTMCVGLIGFIGRTQNLTETKSYVLNTYRVTKMIEIETNDTIPVGSFVKAQRVVNDGNFEYTITTLDTVKLDTIKNVSSKIIVVKKTVPVDVGFLEGKASLKVVDDKAQIKLNYWLNSNIGLKAGTVISYLKRTPDLKTKAMKSTSFDESTFDAYRRPLTHDTTLNMFLVSCCEMDSLWFKQCEDIIAVYKGDKIECFYANKYDSDGTYFIKAENRQYFSSPRRSISVGIVSIPFKYHFGYNKDTIHVKDELTANFNAGVFAGYTWSRYRTRYETGGFVNLPTRGFTGGVAFNISSVQLDKSSTTAGTKPLTGDKKITIGVFSPAIGGMFTVNNVNLGMFMGWDLGFGSSPRSWNFNNKFWIGFGFNYSVTQLWSK